MIVSLSIPDTIATRIVNALCSQYGYQSIITNPDGTTSPNPQTKNQFAKQVIINYIKGVVASSESNTAAETARQTALTSVNTDIQIT